MTQSKSILITGCSSGIGLACARVLRGRGWRVLATARKPADLDMLRNDVGVEAIALDLEQEASVVACAESALALTKGALTALFNNGAYGQVGAMEDITSATLRRQLEINVIAQHELARRIVPSMRRQGHGRIVQCSSVLGLVSAPYRGSYCASKFALEALTDSMRLELAGTGIHVSLIEPGPIRTKFVETAMANFIATVDIEASPHRDLYLTRLERMKAGGKAAFKLEPEAVAQKLIHALESSRPKKRYYVTTPTYLAAGLKRFAPQSAIDWFVRQM
jgi:NAD(P)-dependent dehydrogenase (short-subunit alcohol dehydrogenase family)